MGQQDVIDLNECLVRLEEKDRRIDTLEAELDELRVMRAELDELRAVVAGLVAGE